ncbi:hypothetical protein D049_2341 [Vibrio parahaemolyticus VPTS-2010]|nr:hypothetical protein D049_2341 [Vibrio parahaemolyticus VPTS-2010]
MKDSIRSNCQKASKMRDMDKNASENKEKTARGCNGPNMGLLDELFIFIL